MSFLSRIFGRGGKPPAARKDTVAFDDASITHSLPDGTREIMLWADLEEVAIVTTDDGPFADDVIWVLSGAGGGCLVPSSANGAEALLARLQALPGFDNEAVIQAMGSVENARFVCWRKGLAATRDVAG